MHFYQLMKNAIQKHLELANKYEITNFKPFFNHPGTVYKNAMGPAKAKLQLIMYNCTLILSSKLRTAEQFS